MQSRKWDFGEIVCGAVFVLVGLGVLWEARTADLQHSFILGTGKAPWMSALQGYVAGGLSFAFGLFLVIHGVFRKRKTGGDS
jgi:uncharacterized membrane protein